MQFSFPIRRRASSRYLFNTYGVSPNKLLPRLFICSPFVRLIFDWSASFCAFCSFDIYGFPPFRCRPPIVSYAVGFPPRPPFPQLYFSGVPAPRLS